MKKQLINTSIFTTLLVMLVFSSCKKEDEVKTATDYLTQGNWMITAATIDPDIEMDDGLVTNVYPYLDPCQRDNLMKFNTNGTVAQDEGATKCDPDDPQIIDEGNWAFSNNNKTLTILFPDEDPLVAEVKTLNESTFVMSYEFDSVDHLGEPTTYTYTITWTLQ
jgi:hypothetical protein